MSEFHTDQESENAHEKLLGTGLYAIVGGVVGALISLSPETIVGGIILGAAGGFVYATTLLKKHID